MADDRERPAPVEDTPVRDRAIATEHLPYRITAYGEHVTVLARDGDDYMTADELIEAVAQRVVVLLKDYDWGKD